MGITGAQQYALYKYESAFKGEVAGTFKNLGHEFKLDSYTGKNNVAKLWGLNSNEPPAQVAGKFEGSFSGSFKLSDPWIFRALTGNAATTSGAGPYTHTFLNTDATPTFSNTIPSMAFSIGNDLATDMVLVAGGTVLKSLTMDMKVGEPIDCKAEFDFATETKGTTLDTFVAPTDAPFTFAYATLEFPTATTITNAIQSLTLTITRNPELIWGLGSRAAADYVTKKAEYEIKANWTLSASTMREYMYGTTGLTTPAAVMTEAAGLKITLDNGLATTANRKLVLEFEGALMNEHAISGSVEDKTTEDMTFSIRKWKSCIATNNTSAAP